MKIGLLVGLVWVMVRKLAGHRGFIRFRRISLTSFQVSLLVSLKSSRLRLVIRSTIKTLQLWPMAETAQRSLTLTLSVALALMLSWWTATHAMTAPTRHAARQWR